jgi:hypothetical protein
MDLPIKFPDEADVIAEEAARFRALSQRARMHSIRDMIATGEFIIRNSSKAAFAREFSLEQEKELRSIIQEFIARHAR